MPVVSLIAMTIACIASMASATATVTRAQTPQPRSVEPALSSSPTSQAAASSQPSEKPENIRAAMFPVWVDGFPKSQHPAHFDAAQKKVYEWFVRQGVRVIPQDEVRRQLRLDQAVPVDPEFSTCRSKECAAKMARALDKDFVIQVSVSSLPDGKLIKPVDVTVTLVFADPHRDVVSSFSKITMHDIEAATEATCMQVWQIYQDRLQTHRQPMNAKTAAMAATAAAQTQPADPLAPQLGSTATPRHEPSVWNNYLAAGLLAAGIGFAIPPILTLAQSGDCKEFDSAGNCSSEVRFGALSGLSIAASALSLGGSAFFFFAQPIQTRLTVGSEQASFSLTTRF